MSDDDRPLDADRQERIDAVRAMLDQRASMQSRGSPLDSVLAYLRRFVAYPSEHAAAAHALWVVHTHLMDCWDSTPRIGFLSPEPGSGKSRALESCELLVPRPINAVNASVAFLFRRIGDEEARPTILFDEVDAVFHAKASGAAEEIRALLNAGHRRHSVVGRCETRGREIVTVETPAYAAVALAGLGDLPDTLLSRSVVIRMRRRAPHEEVEPFRRREVQAEADALREWVEVWSRSVSGEAAELRPEFPLGIVDRDADVWEPLLIVANLAGGSWPARARAAAVALVAEGKVRPASLGVRLLTDLQLIFAGRPFVTTGELLAGLCELEEAPWGDLRGKPLDGSGLAKRLAPYGIAPSKIRGGSATLRGYAAIDLADAWSRYCAPVAAVAAVAPSQGEAERVAVHHRSQALNTNNNHLPSPSIHIESPQPPQRGAPAAASGVSASPIGPATAATAATTPVEVWPPADLEQRLRALAADLARCGYEERHIDNTLAACRVSASALRSWETVIASRAMQQGEVNER